MKFSTKDTVCDLSYKFKHDQLLEAAIVAAKINAAIASRGHKSFCSTFKTRNASATCILEVDLDGRRIFKSYSIEIELSSSKKRTNLEDVSYDETTD